MSRYINADKTLAYISHLLGGLPLVLLNECEKNGIDIVRCKECKHHFYDESNDCKMCYIHEYGEIWEDDDYCSYGEREDE